MKKVEKDAPLAIIMHFESITPFGKLVKPFKANEGDFYKNKGVNLRVDKFLKVSRILKRRSVANAACDGGRVDVNGKVVKPSYALKVNDTVSISFGDKKLVFIVNILSEHVKKEDVDKLYTIVNEVN